MNARTTHRPLILASGSRYRKELLERLGIPFRWVAPTCDEDQFKALGLEPDELATRLASEKAMSVAEQHPAATIVASDQVLLFKGTILGKPGSRAEAIVQLTRLGGQTHELLTAVALVQGDRRTHFVDHTRLVMRPLQTDEIERYVDVDQPFDCAGSYKIEARGIALFDRIETQDFTAITGLPLIRLSLHLRELGFSIP